MNIRALTQAIEELEYGEANTDTVQELANLYIVRDHLQADLDSSVEVELTEILPTYRKFCDTKGKYQRHELSQDAVVDVMKQVCNETRDFILALYSSTDCQNERTLIKSMLDGAIKSCTV